MYVPCPCREPHERRRIVITGGPGAGKTAVLEILRHSVCPHVAVLPESAGIVFGGGFPRHEHAGARRAAQRAIFHVQRELEAASETAEASILLCDRGTIDGAAYWPGPGDFFESVGSSLEEQLARYAAVIHLRPPTAANGYNLGNPLRVESAAQAASIDERIADFWRRHPHYRVVRATSQFMDKARRALELVRQELPVCCRHHMLPAQDLAA